MPFRPCLPASRPPSRPRPSSTARSATWWWARSRTATSPLRPSGIKGSALSASEKALVLAAIKTYVYDIDDADAATILAKYTGELDNTYVAFSGNTSLINRNDYVRIDGPLGLD